MAVARFTLTKRQHKRLVAALPASELRQMRNELKRAADRPGRMAEAGLDELRVMAGLPLPADIAPVVQAAHRQAEDVFAREQARTAALRARMDAGRRG